MKIDAHHHLWDLQSVQYPWLMAEGVERFFGDPSPIQRNYLIDEFRQSASSHGITGSVHIQVGAADPMAEAEWVQQVADASPDWPLVQVAFADLTDPDLGDHLDRLQQLPSLRGIRQIIGRAPGEDAQTGTNALLADPKFRAGLRELAHRGLSFDLQLIPELMADTARVLAEVPDLKVALCHAGSPHDRSAAGLVRWADQLRPLSDLPHVTCKLSGLGMFDHHWTEDSFRPIAETCLNQFGQNQLMFGSNFPVDSLYSTYSKLFTTFKSLVPDGWHDAVFGGTAADFYQVRQTAT